MSEGRSDLWPQDIVPSSLAMPPYLEPDPIDFASNQYDLAVDENVLSENELRELYDTEEIQRFLHLFSAYVTEVEAPDSPLAKQYPADTTQLDNNGANEYGEYFLEEGDEWAPLDAPQTSKTADPEFRSYQSISAEIAKRYVVPILSPPRPWPLFTLSRLRLATERLYLATIPMYGPFLRQLYNLASWADPAVSMMYCMVFWVLWWYNLLTPAFIMRIFASLLRRRIFPYPSLEDLRRHRKQVLRADEFGEQISARLSMNASGLKEIWRLFQLYDQTTKKAKPSKEKTSHDDSRRTPEQQTNHVNNETDATTLETVDDSEEVQDFKRIILHIVEELADIHERIRNIFIWRKPLSSRLYAIMLATLLLLSFLPTKYIAKSIAFCLGFLFWHVIPVILALPTSEQKRLPALFADVPTDAEYAMELISQRVAAGLDTKPARSRKNHANSDSVESLDNLPNRTEGSSSQSSKVTSIDWKKWGDRVAFGKSAIGDIKRLRPGKVWAVHEVWPPQHPIIPAAVGIPQPQANTEAHIYPCQHGSTPGLLTLTHNTLLFAPLMSQTAKLIVPLAAVKGVKKAGLLKGLNIRWYKSVNGMKEHKEDKFVWVGSRDELFARLVGSNGRQWMKV
ncbi:hypothetical protein BDN70DRAFT_879870 [Pholiota conissans]|uniref:Uncharacterized protein n=1 Tax=Pholiota conissans TaxID=109636 RepID=A0A9P5YZB2_9AGAR|nr:hypothetical protein BDN70DRAFT_879870 [Pholiota conissans]